MLNLEDQEIQEVDNNDLEELIKKSEEVLGEVTGQHSVVEVDEGQQGSAQ